MQMSRNSWYFYSYKSLLIVIIYQVKYTLSRTIYLSYFKVCQKSIIMQSST
jgi:hypothetical protein